MCEGGAGRSARGRCRSLCGHACSTVSGDDDASGCCARTLAAQGLRAGSTPAASMMALAAAGGAPGANTVLLRMGQLVPAFKKRAVSAKLLETVTLWMDRVQRCSHFDDPIEDTTFESKLEYALPSSG